MVYGHQKTIINYSQGTPASLCLRCLYMFILDGQTPETEVFGFLSNTIKL